MSLATPTRAAGIALVGLVTVCLLATAGVARKDTARAALPPVPALLDGDLVFRRGRDAVSNIVLAQSPHSRFSHVGVVIHRSGQPFVAHAVPVDESGTRSGPGGVRIDPLTHFTAAEAAEAVGYFRVDVLNAAQREQMSSYAHSQVGKPFDPRFSYTDDGAHYCTELALKSLAHAGLPLHAGLERVQMVTLEEGAIAPDALRRSPQLRELPAEAMPTPR